MKSAYNPNRFGELRKTIGLSVTEMADRLGKPEQLVTCWESAVSIPSLSDLIHIINVFDCPIDYFIVNPCDDSDGSPA